MLENDECSLMVEGDENNSAEAFNRNYESEPVEPEKPEKPKQWALRDRLRSKVVWVGVVAEVISILAVIGVLKKFNVTPTAVEAVAYGFIKIMELFGIFNDPTNREGF